MVKKHKFNRIRRVSDVHQQVEEGHKRHHHQIIPSAMFTLNRTGVLFKHIQRPNYNSSSVHNNSQCITDSDQHVEEKRKHKQQPGDGQEYDEQ